MRQMGFLLVLAGCVLIVGGLLFMLSDKLSFFGQLPGDIRIEGERSTFYFPIVTCIVLSVLLTLVLNVVVRLFQR